MPKELIMDFLVPIGDKLPDAFLLILGILIGLIPAWYSKRKAVRNHWGNLFVEIIACKSRADTYLRDQISCPLYRLPTSAFQISLPELISAGEVNEKEINVLTRYSNQVANFNRGLENASNLRLNGTPEATKIINDEFNRNILYARDLTDSVPPEETLYSYAVKVIKFRRNPWLKRFWHLKILTFFQHPRFKWIQNFGSKHEDNVAREMDEIDFGKTETKRDVDLETKIKNSDLNYIKELPIADPTSGTILNTLWHYQKIVDPTFNSRFTFWAKSNQFISSVGRMIRAGIVGKDNQSGQAFLTDVGILFCTANESKICQFPKHVFKTLDDRSNPVFAKST